MDFRVAMRRYAAFLRGVSPMNAKMPELKRCFEAAGFREVRTVLASGNIVFSGPSSPIGTLERKAEKAMSKALSRTFLTIVRPIDHLRGILDSDPYAHFRVASNAKRVVTFMRNAPKSTLALPIEVDGARILCVKGREIYTAYVRSPKGPVFMTLIQKTFGDELTTRTWETVEKVTAI